MVSVRAAARLQPRQLVSVAPAVNLLGSIAQPLTMPWLIVQGDADQLVPVAAVRQWVEGLQPKPEFVVLPGVDHFFHGELGTLRDTLLQKLGDR